MSIGRNWERGKAHDEVLHRAEEVTQTKDSPLKHTFLSLYHPVPQLPRGEVCKHFRCHRGDLLGGRPLLWVLLHHFRDKGCQELDVAISLRGK